MSDSSSEIAAINSLDPDAITAIHDRYYRDVYRFTRFRLNDEVLAEDITGDVFMRLLEAIHHGHGPVSNLRGWLISTAANMVNDHFRKLYRQPTSNLTEIHENFHDLFINPEDPGLLTDQAEQKQMISAALERLTENQKLVITLRFGNRFSLEEVGKVMGKNANTIKALQYRALLALRKYLSDDIL